MALSKIESQALDVGQIGGRRNLIINGAMQVAQRGTSAVNGGGGYNTLDRWRTSQNSSGFGGSTGLDQYQSTDAPDGFANSLKFVKNGATNINASVAAYLEYKIEGQDVQHLKYGTASAQSVTLSFWVKNSITGTYGLTLLEAGNARYNTQTYTVDTANTWEYKTVTFVGDTAASLANDNTDELNILFVLGGGTDFQTATTNTWSASATYTTSSQVQWPETDDAEFYLTGVQLEVGSVATPFEHRSYGEELALCQRYYERWARSGNLMVTMGHTFSVGASYGVVNYKTKRAEPDCTSSTGLWRIRVGGVGNNETTATLTFANINIDTARVLYSGNGTSAGVTGWIVANHDAYVEFDAEL